MAAFLLLTLSAFPAWAQSFTIDSQVIGGGGGTSSGGGFSVSGTIGQSDAGPKLTGGPFTVEGGFWSAYVAVQTPGAPTLSIMQVGNNVEIRWPVAGSSGFVLQDSGTVRNGATWTVVVGPPVVVEGVRVVTLQTAAGQHFFRLRMP